MSESVRKYAEEYAEEYAKAKSVRSAEASRINTLAQSVKMLMKNLKCSLEDAMNTLEIKGKERAIIAKQLQK